MKRSLFVTLLLALPVMAIGVGPLAAQGSPCCTLGDANGSGTVSTFDLVLYSRHMLDIACLDEEELCNGDVDGDGLVTQADIDLIREYILFVRRTFPRCGDLDNDGQLEWGSNEDDVNCFTSIALGGSQECAPAGAADANDDGILDLSDISIFISHSNGGVQSFPGCACGDGSCAQPQ